MIWIVIFIPHFATNAPHAGTLQWEPWDLAVQPAPQVITALTGLGAPPPPTGSPPQDCQPRQRLWGPGVLVAAEAWPVQPGGPRSVWWMGADRPGGSGEAGSAEVLLV